MNNIFKVNNDTIFEHIIGKYNNKLIVVVFIKNKKREYSNIDLLKKMANTYNNILFIYINQKEYNIPFIDNIPFKIYFNKYVLATIDCEFNELVPEAINTLTNKINNMLSFS